MCLHNVNQKKGIFLFLGNDFTKFFTSQLSVRWCSWKTSLIRS